MPTTAHAIRRAIAARAAAPRPVSPRSANVTRAFFELYADLPHLERHARSLAHALVNEPVHVFPHENLVGAIYQTSGGGDCPRWGGGSADQRWEPLSAAAEAARRVARELPEDAGLTDPAGGAFLISEGAYPGQIGWRWERVLERGVLHLIADCRRRAADGPENAHFFEAVAVAWEAVLQWNDRHISALEAAHAAAVPADRPHIQRTIDICRRVPALPARSFREALQAFHLQHLAIMYENPYGGNGPGRVDHLLGPWLDRDLASGAITLEQARDLVFELLLRFHERLAPADGWVETIMVGGADADGRWTGGALSRLIVECFIELNQTHPAVYMRTAASAPADYMDLAARYLAEGHNRAQILNDDAIVPAMMAAGLTADEATDYMCGGCMELSAQGLASDMRFTLVHSIPKVVELILTGGECLTTGRRRAGFGPGLSGFPDFEALYAAFEAELTREASIAVRRLDIWSECAADRRPTLLVSSLVDDCLERGLEMHAGGARCHDYGAAPVGIPDAADALHAVEQALYVMRLCSADELVQALRANFAGHEELRNRLLRIPGFGQEDPGADAMAARVLRSVAGACARVRTRFGGRLLPMVFNFVWTPMVGGALGAAPHGRRAGEPVAHGLTPRSAAMIRGLTAAINSSTSLPQTLIPGGATTMWDLDEDWASAGVLGAILRAFNERGGQILQGNTTSVEDLRRAMDRPGDYPYLTVRVGGFSARFVGLDRAVQQEIIARCRHRAG